jgi:TRAP transporter TAXI family solute receptor
LGLGAALLLAMPAVADDIIIGTGSTAGVYYQVGRAICFLITRVEQSSRYQCRAPSTAGSIANLQDLRAGKLDVAVAQSDWQYHALRGSSVFQDAGPDGDLRALFSVHGEPFTLVVRRDSGIRQLADLKGRRVNIGNPGSGQRATMEVVMAAMGWTKADFLLAEELPASQQSLALCHNQVQAMIYTVGHPNASVAKATGLCDATIARVEGPAIDQLVNDNTFYAYTVIPGGMYNGNPDPVTTFGVKATVVSSAKVDADKVYAVVKAVFDNLAQFQTMHPAFGVLDGGAMTRDGLSAPLHDGALRYYREKGLVQ